MPSIGIPELVIILVIVLILFGVGRVSKISEELGKSIRGFRDGLQGKDAAQDSKPEEKESKSSSK